MNVTLTERLADVEEMILTPSDAEAALLDLAKAFLANASNPEYSAADQLAWLSLAERLGQ